ncbi:MAG: alkaline phosphatase [bacterium]|nr:alkaline phosphatase [bacterium]
MTTSLLFAEGSREVPESASKQTMPGISYEEPKHVFLFIGDGLSASQRQLSQYFLQEFKDDQSASLRMNTFPVAGMNTTHSLNSLVTDSAASATALATGRKTNSKVVGQSPDGTDLKNLIEAAKEKGFATGVVSTMRLTHATPASFLAHNESRYNENEMAVDVLESGVNYLAGGGYRHFVKNGGELKSKRKDDRDLVAEFKALGYTTFVNDTEGLRNFKPEGRTNVFAPVSYSVMDYEIDRDPLVEPSLKEMTSKGIDVLSQYEEGFFMMVEGGKIDYASHANDPIGVVHDVLAFDEAIEAAYSFYLENPDDTLIIVLGDHETGGLGLGFKNDYFLDLESLLPIKKSADGIRYDGDRDAFFSLLEADYGLTDLTDEEIAKIIQGMDMADADTKPAHMSSYMSPVNASVSEIVSSRANLFWTTYAHTGTTVPLTAIGAGSLSFSGYKDNTEIGLTIAELMGISLY